MFDDLKSVMQRVLKLGSLLVLGVTVIGSIVGFLVAGTSGLLAALAGGAAAFAFTALTVLSLLFGSKLNLGGFLGVVLGGWLIKVLLFLVLFSSLNRAEWLTLSARPVVFFVVVAAVIGGLVLDTLVVTKARIAPSV
ncbi:MAG: hypothetical protein RLZZ606_315 [Actinomycetota bacterium]|jgi:hypothetical protein